MEDQVITPELEKSFVPKPLEVQEIEGEQIKEEIELATIVDHKGWNIVLNKINEDIATYKDVTRFRGFKGGVNELATSVEASAEIVTYLEDFKALVESAVDARDK